jgi:hypothetical protein
MDGGLRRSEGARWCHKRGYNSSAGGKRRKSGRPGSMDPKPKPSEKLYLEVLRRMTPEQRLLKALELSEMTRQLFLHGLRKRFPDASPEEFRQLVLKHLAKCHNLNY